MASREMLSGIKILSLTQFLLGPAAVQYLGDLGAEIIKVEPPAKGAWERSWAGANTFPGGVSAFYLMNHRNVRSVTLNLKDSRGRDVALQLIKWADVVVENFRPGVMAKFGLGYEEAKRVNERIIYASASGYGQDSPHRDLPGQDLLLQAMSGLAAITGRQSDLPVPAGASIVDQHGASLLAMAILAALFHRERSGEGQRIETTMLQAALDLQSEPLAYYLNGGEIKRPRNALGSSFHPAPYGIYRTKDGFMALSLSPVKTIRKALGGAESLARYEDPDMAIESRDEIWEALQRILAEQTTDHWLGILRCAGVWCAPVLDYDSIIENEAVQYLEPILTFKHPEAGSVRLVGTPARYSAWRPVLRRVPPRLGEHTDSILRELGYSSEDLAQLRRDCVV